MSEPVEQTPSMSRPAEPARVSQVGRYVLLKQLGQGGMGVVFAAYDPDLDRQVALKLLRSDKGRHPEEARARLLREAQAMARVSHPNVIPVFDVGLWGDQVFLAMEIIDGTTLSDWLRDKPRPWREVLDTLLEAGRGLLAAHEVGLVHRDFKPANVLVSRTGRVYVTDFGLARQSTKADGDETSTFAADLPPPQASAHRMLEVELTHPGAVMGTPNYMSPEQVRGADVDARSDQFSFCVSLYWALYRQRPFDPDQLRRTAGSGSPRASDSPPTRAERKPRERTGSARDEAPVIQEPPRDVKVPAWVREAVMRGLSVDPAERFASMRELLQALSQAARRERRFRVGVGVGVGALGLALVAGGVYRHTHVCARAGELMDGVWNPQVRGQVEASLLATGQPFARDVSERVLGVLEGYARDWSQQRVEACEATRRHGVQTEEVLSRRDVCLERRRQDMKALVDVLSQADAPLVERAVDATHALPVLSECADGEALSERQRLPVDAAQRARIAALDGRVAELKALVDTGRLALARTRVGTLAEEVEATRYLPLMAELHTHRGWLKQQQGQAADALADLVRGVHEAEGGRADRLKLDLLVRLVFLEGTQKHFDRADGWSEWAEATLRRIGGDALLHSSLLINRANVESARARLPEARALLEQARDVLQRAVPEGHARRARVTFLLGGVLGRMGEHARAVELLEQALTQTEAAVGPLHPDMARRHAALSWALREAGRPEDSLEHAQASARIFETLLGADDLQTAEAQDEVGQCLLELQRPAEALEVYQRALAAKQRKLPPGDESLQYTWDGVGQALLGLGRAREAVEPLRHAVSFAAMDPDELAPSSFALARALAQQGQRREAREEAERARALYQRAGQEQDAARVLEWMNTAPGMGAARASRR